MVSLRVLKQQQEEALRKERIQSARRVASQLGVASARNYDAQKRDQEHSVSRVLQERSVAEMIAKRDFLTQVVDEGRLRQGEGMRNAQAFMEQSVNRCREEAAAWDAERALEYERYRLAIEERTIIEERKREKQEEQAQRRALVAETENRRREALLHRKGKDDFSRISSRDALSFLNIESKSRDSASVSIAHGPANVRGDIAAKEHMEAKRTLEEMRAMKAREEQRKAAERAKRVVRDMKEAEEQRRMQEEHEAMLKQSMAANAMRSALRPVSSTDFQEQEVHKAQSLQRRCETEFATTFLSGPWSADSIQRHHVAPPLPSVESSSLLEACSASELLGTVPQHRAAANLLVLPLEVSDFVEAIDVSHRQEDAHDEPAYDEPAHDIHNSSVDGHIEPEAHSPETIPMPTPKTCSASPPQEDDGPQNDSCVDAAAQNDSSTGTATSNNNHSQLRERQHQFLRDLEALQLRLAKATSHADVSTAAKASNEQTAFATRDHTAPYDANSSGSTALSAEGDMSISSMSSLDLSTRALCSHDDSTTTASTADGMSSAIRKKLVGLSAEQLKESLRRMRRAPQGAEKSVKN